MKPAYRLTGNALQGFLKRLTHAAKPGKQRILPVSNATRSREPARQENSK